MLVSFLSLFLIFSPISEDVSPVMVQEQLSDLEEVDSATQEVIDFVVSESEDEQYKYLIQDGTVNLNHNVTVKYDYAPVDKSLAFGFSLSFFLNLLLFWLWRRDLW